MASRALFDINDTWFTIIFDRPTERWSEKRLTEMEIITEIKRNPKISEILEINQSAVQKHLDKLKEKGVLKGVGAAKGSYWKIV